jgi:hypothetical protein
MSDKGTQAVECSWCDDDGYTETWNDDQSDVVITLCAYCAMPGRVCVTDGTE